MIQSFLTIFVILIYEVILILDHPTRVRTVMDSNPIWELKNFFPSSLSTYLSIFISILTCELRNILGQSTVAVKMSDLHEIKSDWSYANQLIVWKDVMDKVQWRIQGEGQGGSGPPPLSDMIVFQTWNILNGLKLKFLPSKDRIWLLTG